MVQIYSYFSRNNLILRVSVCEKMEGFSKGDGTVPRSHTIC